MAWTSRPVWALAPSATPAPASSYKTVVVRKVETRDGKLLSESPDVVLPE